MKKVAYPRVCTGCGLPKQQAEFAWVKVGVRRQSKCRTCRADINRTWRRDNPDAWRTSRKPSASRARRLRVQRNKAWLWNLRRTTRCADCNRYHHPAALDFDHGVEVKTSGIMRMLSCSRDKIEREIAKCEIVCARCHRIRTLSLGQFASQPNRGPNRRSEVHVEEVTDGGKRCRKCGRVLRVEDFAWRSKSRGVRHATCKECCAGYQHDWHLASAESRRSKLSDQKSVRRAEAAVFVDAIKSSTPCLDCGEMNDPVAVDFDHVMGTKGESISALVHQGASIERIKFEMAKCEIACANCHRIRTYTRRIGLRERNRIMGH